MFIDDFALSCYNNIVKNLSDPFDSDTERNHLIMKKTPLLQRRRSGILMPIFSLSSPYGIGTMGKEAYDFVDFLKKAGQSYWQILPLGPTTFGDSPYQSYSTFAGNPYFIDLDTLCKEGYLTKEVCEAQDFGSDPEDINYPKLYKGRLVLMRQALEVFLTRIPEDFGVFCKKNAFWLEDYALFMALKYENNNRRIKARLKGLPPAIHRQQALLAA